MCSIGCGQKVAPVDTAAHGLCCSAKIVSCPAYDVGCSFKGKRGILPQHTSSCIVLQQRPILLQLQQQQQQIQLLQQQVQQLQQERQQQIEMGLARIDLIKDQEKKFGEARKQVDEAREKNPGNIPLQITDLRLLAVEYMTQLETRLLQFICFKK